MCRKTRITTRIISVILVMLMLLEIAPMSVFAEDFNEIINEKQATSDESEENEEVHIISEVTDERTEYTKTFLMSDGSFTLTQYAQPIHYLSDDDQWVDYDNFIEKADADSSEKDLFSQSIVYKTNNENSNVVFAQKSNSNTLVAYEDEEYPISWNYQSTKNSKIKVVDKENNLEGDDKFLTLENVTSEAIYENIYKDVDLQYIVGPTGTKENIILKNSNAQSTFTVRYNIGKLTANVVDDKTIELISGDEVFYTIKVPCMFDANGEISNNILMTVQKNHNGMLTVEISADEEWLNNESRAYPVTLDPYVATYEDLPVTGTFISSANKTTNYSEQESVYVSKGSSDYGTSYALLKVDAQSLGRFGDHIVSAKLSLPIDTNTNDTAILNLYKITSAWDETEVTWSNQPTASSIVSDYAKITSTSKRINFDITNLYQKWNEGTLTDSDSAELANYGMMIKASDNKTVSFKISDEETPVLTLNFVNTVGINDDYSYTQFDMGLGGTVSINNLTGNLIIQRYDISTTGDYASYDLFSTYNSYGATNDDTVKWRKSSDISISMLQCYISEDGSGAYLSVTKDESEDSTFIVAENDFGFEKITITERKKIVLAVILGKEISITIPSAYDAWKNNGTEKYSFDLKGLTKKVINIDSSGNGETVFSREDIYDDEGNKVAGQFYIVDGSGDKLYIEETDSENTITQIDMQPDGTYTFGEKVTYVKDGNGNVTQIKRNADIQSTFTYDANNRMTSITDDANHTVTFTYSGNSRRIASVQESYNGSAGQKISFDRTYDSVTVRSSGADSVYGNDDDVLTTYTFDSYAKLIGERSETVSGEDLGAISYDRDSTTNSEKSLFGSVSKIASVGKNPDNLLKNHNIESMENWTARYIDDSKCSYKAEYSTDKAYVGNGSLKMTVNSISKTGGATFYQEFLISDGIIQAGKTYKASVFINTSKLTRQSVADSTKNYGAAIMVKTTKSDGTTSRTYSQNIHATDSNIDGGWERAVVGFTVADNATKITVYLIVRNAVGTVYFDAAQLEDGDSFSQYNLIENNGFTYTDSNNYANDWKRYNLEASDVVTNGQMKISGNTAVHKGVYQDVPLKDAKQDDKYVVSGWAQANSVPKASGRHFLIYATVYYKEKDANGKTISYQEIQSQFNYNYEGVQYTCGAFDLKHPTDESLTPDKIRIVVCYYNELNTALFDSISLVKTTDVYEYSNDMYPDDSAYTYDDDGNVTTYTDENGVVYTYTYDNMGNLLSSLNSSGKGDRYTYFYYDTNGDGQNDKSLPKTESYEDGSSCTYTYHSNNNLETVTIVSDGVTTVYTFDIDGNLLTESETSGKSYTYTYDDMGNVLSKLTADGKGNRYTYTYFDMNGDGTNDNSAVSKEELEDGTVNTYTYTTKGVLTAQSTVTNGKTLKYTYNANGQTTSVEHNGFKYNYIYDSFGNPTSVKVGSQTLVTYVYQANNGKLDSTTYGNGSKETYTYNAYGEMTKKTQKGLGSFTFKYDTQGRLYYEKDAVKEQKTYHRYDSNGRNVGELVYSSAQSNAYDTELYDLKYNYDDEGRITKNSLTANGTTFSTTYSYTEKGLNAENVLTSIRKLNFVYDDNNRLITRTLSCDTPVVEQFTYTDDEAISTHKINNDTYSYTYDDNGNITEIKKNGTVTQSYVYDTDNQLIRENNLDTNKTTVYTYDNGGNIANKTEYAFTTGNLGAVKNTISYTYDSTWKDKLTSYNGESISYDAIGNPTTYRGATATWFGRQMQSYTKGNTSVTYTYDSDGLRTSKTVNGVQYDYYYVDGQLMYEKKGSEYELWYRYDADGRLALVIRNRFSDNHKSYYYVITNAQGDVIEIHDGLGEVTAKYTYDAWGKLISVTDSNGNALAKDHFAYQISVRYRGYVYDDETGLYYLQSRYFDPEIGRFINADNVNLELTESILSYSTFAYCNNNPVRLVDPTGYDYVYNNNIVLAYEHLIFNFLTVLSNFMKYGGYINGQGLGYISKLKYGCATLSYNGCELIAIYNALKRIGKSEGIYKIIFDAETQGGMVSNGLFGTFPSFIPRYLKTLGVSTKSYYSASTLDSVKKGYDVFIVVFNHSAVMVHTVMVEISNTGKLIAYNMYNNSTKTKEYNSFSEMIKKEGNFIIVAYKIG